MLYATHMHEAKRLEKIVRTIIAPVLLQAPRECGVVTITDVEVTKDLQFAKVFVSALAEPNAALAFMENKQKALQHALRTKVDRRVPQLRFELDPRTERGQRIDELLGEN